MNSRLGALASALDRLLRAERAHMMSGLTLYIPKPVSPLSTPCSKIGDYRQSQSRPLLFILRPTESSAVSCGCDAVPEGQRNSAYQVFVV